MPDDYSKRPSQPEDCYLVDFFHPRDIGDYAMPCNLLSFAVLTEEEAKLLESYLDGQFEASESFWKMVDEIAERENLTIFKGKVIRKKKE